MSSDITSRPTDYDVKHPRTQRHRPARPPATHPLRPTPLKPITNSPPRLPRKTRVQSGTRAPHPPTRGRPSPSNLNPERFHELAHRFHAHHGPQILHHTRRIPTVHATMGAPHAHPHPGDTQTEGPQTRAAQHAAPRQRQIRPGWVSRAHRCNRPEHPTLQPRSPTAAIQHPCPLAKDRSTQKWPKATPSPRSFSPEPTEENRTTPPSLNPTMPPPNPSTQSLPFAPLPSLPCYRNPRARGHGLCSAPFRSDKTIPCRTAFVDRKSVV